MGLVITEFRDFEAEYFLNRFHYYLIISWWKCQHRKREREPYSQELEPVYGIAILGKYFSSLNSPANVYEMRHTVDGTPLYSSRKDGVAV